MDENIDPCENFYEFTCGSFKRKYRIEDSQTKISEFSMLRDTVSYSIAGKNLYNSNGISLLIIII